MKTAPFKRFKFRIRLSLTVAIAAAIVRQPTFAHELVLIEESAYSLTVTYDGSASGIVVNNIETDHWFVIGPPRVTPAPSLQWLEPDSSSDNGDQFVNVVTPASSFPVNPLGLIVRSDILSLGGIVNANGASRFFAVDVSDNVPISIRFIDNSDVPSVPDTSCTLDLLFLSLGLICAVRLTVARSKPTTPELALVELNTPNRVM
jgi:hypothetical protein